jgi:hypothetical protein
MKLNHRLVLATAAVLSVIVSVDAAQNILLNGSFENSDPNALDPFVPGGWELNGNVIERSAEANLVPALPPGEGHALKAFQSNPTELAFQEIAVVGGTDTVTISAELFTRNFDKVGGDAIAGIGLGFFDAGNNQVGGSTQFDFVMDASSPADTWIPASVGPVLAPVGATKARMTCVWISNNGSGAAFWDDAKLTLNGDPTNLLANGDFELAGEGEASPNAIDDWGGFEDQRPTNDFSLHGDTSLRIGTGAPFNGLFPKYARCFRERAGPGPRQGAAHLDQRADRQRGRGIEARVLRPRRIDGAVAFREFPVRRRFHLECLGDDRHRFGGY